MHGYNAPIDDIMRAMRVAGLGELLAMAHYDGIDEATIASALEGFGTLAGQVVTPTDAIGDRQPPVLARDTGEVTVPAEVAHAFDQYIAGGWGAISAPAEHGGGGFPKVVATAVHEMFGSANMALSLNPMLTQSGIELLERWGDDRQREVVLPRLVSGEWTGTMNLTEPDAGSDLGAIRTTAEPSGDGRWVINGTKIFITWGEHGLRDNIIHLVLARTPDAPAGTRGISLFIVPKVHFAADGGLGARNGVRCVGLEHKLGIHGSPTCVMSFEDAIGEMVGPLHGGMPAMFSMMNPARLAVGVQGVSIGERARQQAVAYAAERRQGADPERPGASVTIDVHPDVRRMLADITSTVDATRMLCFATSIAGDLADRHDDEERRERARRRVDLLTPLSKSFGSDQGVRMASLAVQVHGGMGFVEETGIAQRYRDARIAPIYEGTNGIQAIDLVMRKIVRDQGLALGEMLDEIASGIEAASAIEALAEVRAERAAAAGAARDLGPWQIATAATHRDGVLTGATAYQELLSLVVCGHLLLASAVQATDDAQRAAAVARARCFAAGPLSRRPGAADVALPSATVDAVLGG